MPESIQQFDNPLVKAIMDECEEALQPIAEKYGLVLARKGRTYQYNALPVMFQFQVLRKTGGARQTPEAVAFKLHAERVGLKPEDLGKTFKRDGFEHTIVGFKTRATKRPIVVERSDGKRYVYAPDAVKLFLGNI